MIVRVTTQKETCVITSILPTYTWSGSKGAMARSFEFTMAVSELASYLPRVDVPVGSMAELLTDEGTALFRGHVVQRKRSSDGVTMVHRCLDRGMYLGSNDGWYTIKDTPEAAVRRICGDFGIPVGTLAAAGVKVVRKFPGVALSKIVGTLYSLAAERSGKRYHAVFDGSGALCVTERTEGDSGLALARRVNLMSTSVTESIEKMCNSVAIYDEYGNRLRTVEDADAVALYGLMQRAVTQKKSDDAAGKAKALLEDGVLAQDIEAECLGDPRMVTGKTITLRENGTGLTGVFWIDADTHTWKNGLCLSRLTLNLRNVVDSQTAGTEVK